LLRPHVEALSEQRAVTQLSVSVARWRDHPKGPWESSPPHVAGDPSMRPLRAGSRQGLAAAHPGELQGRAVPSPAWIAPELGEWELLAAVTLGTMCARARAAGRVAAMPSKVTRAMPMRFSSTSLASTCAKFRVRFWDRYLPPAPPRASRCGGSSSSPSPAPRAQEEVGSRGTGNVVDERPQTFSQVTRR
jgi:hypothetical protein